MEMPILLLFIFPSDELGAQRIEPVPIVHSSGLTIGDLVLKTAWTRGLSPRLFYLESTSGTTTKRDTVIKFVHRHQFIPV